MQKFVIVRVRRRFSFQLSLNARNMPLQIYLLFYCVGFTLSANVETRSYSKLYPSKSSSTLQYYFGASTATVLNGQDGHRMFVGAPHHGNRISNVPAGAFYSCVVSGNNDIMCDTAITTAKVGAIGMSIDQLSTAGDVAVCGSQFVQSCPTAQVQQRMIGVCYKYGSQLEELPTPCTWACPGSQRVDLVFVVDDSGSVKQTNFDTGLKWLLAIVANFKDRIDNGEYRVALILFSERIAVYFSLKTYVQDYAGLTAAISKTGYIEGGFTRTGTAIERAIEELATNGRLSSTRLMIVLTDGGSNGRGPTVTASSNAARAAGIITVGVGVGGFRQSEIDTIAGSPNRALTATDYTKLDGILQEIVAVIKETANSGLEGSTSNSTNDVSQCQLGFSSSTSSNNLYLGSVGSYDRIGTIMGYPTPVSKSSKPQLLNITGLETIAKPENLTQLKETYLGYSVANGKFQGGNVEFVASGEPRYNSKGRVIIIESNQLPFPKSNYYTVHPFGSIWQLGAYFGQSVLSVDINNDNFDDLLVSAPLYSSQGGYDQGRVFVYMNNPNTPGPQYWQNAFFTPITLFGSNAIGCRFGMSISRVGDVDQNGYDDIVIGAPMESVLKTTSGAVYLYYGSLNGLSELHKQKILGSSVAESLVNFGYSITKGPRQGIDVDGNKYPDLLISAPSSDKVIILRSRPVVDVTASVTITPSSVDLMTCLRSLKCATMKVCIRSQQRSATTDSAYQMVTTLSLDNLVVTATGKRIQFVDNSTTATTLTNSRSVNDLSQCYTYDIRLNSAAYAPTGGLSSQPLIITYSYDFTTTHKNTLQSAVLDPIGSTFAQAEWLVSTGCTGNNKQCIHDLGLSAVFSIPSSQPYVIENGPGVMTVTVTISNAGPEHSFFTKVVVSSNGLSINQITSTCAIKADTLSTVGNVVLVMNNLASVLMNGETCIVTLAYSLEDLRRSASITSLSIRANVYSGRNDTTDPNSRNDVITYNLPIKYRVDLVTGGTSFPIETIFVNHSSSADYITSLTHPLLGGNQSDLQHTLTIENRGTNLLSSAWFHFTWPESTKDGFPLLYLYDFKCLPQIYCTCDVTNKVNKHNIPMYDNGVFNLSVKFPTISQAILTPQIPCSSVSCGVITCQIVNQSEFATVTVSARYKLWLPSLSQPDLSTTFSSVILLNTSASPIDPQKGEITIQVSSLIKAFVMGATQPVTNGGINIGAIIGAIIGGIALLAIIGLALWKFGFFENEYQDKLAQARALQEGTEDPGMNNVSPDVTKSTADLVEE